MKTDFATRWLAAVAFALALCSCSGPDEPALQVRELQIFAPVPGSSSGVAYFELHNAGSQPATLQRVTSPQFSAVQMHETVLEDGMSTMRAVDSVRVAPQSSASFETGGKHLMLMKPSAAPNPGDLIELRLHFDDDQVVFVSTTMQTRFGDSRAPQQ